MTSAAARLVAQQAAHGDAPALISLMGGVIGGWMGSGEPMVLSHRVATSADRATDRI